MSIGNRCILVIGIHRSGTSAVAGVLHRLGVWMGQANPKTESELEPLDDWPAYESNPMGQFEDSNFCAVNRSLLGPNWRNPQTPLNLKGEGYAEVLAAVHGKDKPLFGLKDPALCFTWPIWVREFRKNNRDIRVLLVRRLNFDASCRSLSKREDMPLQVAEHILSRYWINLSEAADPIKNTVPTGVVAYERLLESPKEVVCKIAEFVYDGLPVEPTEDELQNAISHIDPSLNHA